MIRASPTKAITEMKVWLLAAAGLACTLLASPTPAQSSPVPIVISNVRILDLSEDGPKSTPGMSVLIEDGVIAAVEPSGALDPPPRSRVLDGGGHILMPGLTDMHVHVWDRSELGAYLAHGVTTVRNASGMPFHLRLAREIAEGRIAGPRLITTGPILNSPGPNAQINHQMVKTGDEARVRSQHAAGYRRIKVYSNLSREAYDAVRDEARSLGMTLMGHSPEGVRETGTPHSRPFAIKFEELLDDGFVTFEHMETIVWYGLRDRRDPVGARRLAQKIAAADVAVDPTLLAFHNLLRTAETKGAFLARPEAQLMNPLLVAQEQKTYARWSREPPAPAREAFEFYKLVTRIFAQEGVRLVAGSDAGIFSNPPGVSLIDELELLVEAGLSRGQALQATTRNAAAVLGEAHRSGRVAVGHRADLILVAGDPLADIRSVGRPIMVVAAGRPFDRAELAELAAAALSPDVSRTRRTVAEGLRAQGTDPTPILSAR